ncbi:MAG: Na+/H+ antiporter subunit E [Ilumatobacteraceae bacterium]|jgi:multicomponent Na+:H+ antiporter subunit E
MITRSMALLLLWIALWGEVSVANVLSGVLVVAIVSWLFAHDRPRRYVMRPVPALRLLLHVLVSLVGSSVRVVFAVLFPTRERIATSVQSVALQQGSVFVGAVVANAITLTPGTMSLDLDESTLVLSVHVLGLVDPDEFRRDVLQLENLVARAVRERTP